ncbi:electron transport complex protein RnfE [Selenomonas sp. GACV-9]|uniref:electron transport complex subunit RsxE n=1 Tax=Selenomonas sp. GACV-9 TaxID=3158782 RepID=UPI0008EF548F|nr:electron transport complex protein RnfE [Selenomonas ruminantium]
MKELWQIFSKGLVAENPIFILALSLCPALAVTTTVINGLTMGLTVTFVITTNNVVVSIVRKWVNPKVRVPVYITSIATIVTVAQLVLQAYFPELYKAMGIYLALVVVFAIILARAEVYASKHGVVKSFADGFGMGCGFTLAMLIISVIRELIGAGTILGMPVFGEGYEPMLMMVLPPGAFILIGYLVAATKTWNKHVEERRAREARRLEAMKGAES